MEQRKRRSVIAKARDAWQRGWAMVRHHPARALMAVVAVVFLVLVVRWLVPDRVDTVTPERREVVETLVTTGRVRSVSRAGIGVATVGTVARVAVDEGDRVSAGQVLFTLEDAEQRAAVDEARARLAAAEATLSRVASVELPGATATLDAAELEASQLRRDVERLQTLYDAGGLTRQELEAAVQRAAAAQARLENARARARSVAGGGAERRVAEAGIAQARQAVDAALARLELTRARSPAAGTLLIRDVEPGDAVQLGRVLMEIALDGPTELIVFPDERSVARLHEGQPAVASADAFPDQRFDATVTRIAPVVNPQQGTIEVRLSVPDPPSYLLPDMTVSVNVELARRPAAWTLPLGVVRAPLSDTAWVLVVRDGRAQRARVDVGIRDERYIEVVSGIDEDEPVVVDAEEVEIGARVRARSSRRADR